MTTSCLWPSLQVGQAQSSITAESSVTLQRLLAMSINPPSYLTSRRAGVTAASLPSAACHSGRHWLMPLCRPPKSCTLTNNHKWPNSFKVSRSCSC
jgi:hypothetical protein